MTRYKDKWKNTTLNRRRLTAYKYAMINGLIENATAVYHPADGFTEIEYDSRLTHEEIIGQLKDISEQLPSELDDEVLTE